MGDLWEDEGYGGENDWDEGESLESDVEEGFPDREEPEEEDDASWGDGPETE